MLATSDHRNQRSNTIANVRHIGRSLRRQVRRLRMSSSERRHALVGPAEVWKVKRDFQIAFLLDHGLQPGDRLADLGCGTLRGGIPIIDYLEPGRYHGFDVRAEVLREAQQEVEASGLAGKHPVLTQSDDLGSLELGIEFDVIWAFSVLMHLRDELLDGAFGFARRHLAAGGVMYANVSPGDREDGQWQGFPVVHRPLDFYAEAAARNSLAMEQLGSLASLGHPPGPGAPQIMLRLTAAAGQTESHGG
jgi:SAM-dependent methyltransferase